MVTCKYCISPAECSFVDACSIKEWIDDLDDGVEDNISDINDFPELIEEEEARLNSRLTLNRKLIFEPILLGNLLQYIKVAFRDDSKLLSKIHISPGNLNHCAKHTYSNITRYGVEGLVFFKLVHCIEDADEIHFEDIGFLVIHDNPNCLISFGLNIAYRNKNIKKKWLEMIAQLFVPVHGIPYVVTVHSKNKRAITFFKHNGFQFQVNANKTVSLWQSFSPPQ